MSRTPANKGRKLPPEPLTDDDVKRLIGVCSRRAPTGIRNRALIVALYRGGLRIAEAMALRPKDLDAQAGTVRILEGKGRKARTVGLDPGAFAQIELWLRVRAGRGINGHAAVFCTLEGRPLATAYVRALLPRLAKKAGIEKRVHPHGLRHTFASQLRSEGHRRGHRRHPYQSQSPRTGLGDDVGRMNVAKGATTKAAEWALSRWPSIPLSTTQGLPLRLASVVYGCLGLVGLVPLNWFPGLIQAATFGGPSDSDGAECRSAAGVAAGN